jgi:beta-lactamase class A
MRMPSKNAAWLTFILLGALCVFAAAPAAAQSTDPAKIVERLFRKPVQESWFTQTFLTQAPVATIAHYIDRLKERYGPLQQVTAGKERLTVHLERADVPTRVALDSDGLINGLLFEAAVPTTGDVMQEVAAIAALPGRTSALVLTDGKVVAAHEPETPLAVGSTFKLAVLKATAEAVARGRLAWDEVVRLDPAWRSLPTSILSDWPAGTPLTVATLVNLMMAIGDNTASDALIDLVGRDAVEAESPRNAPLLTTREFFKLKAAPQELRRRWADGDAAARRKLLAEIAGTDLPTVDAANSVTPGVEWFMSATELCAFLEATRNEQAAQINAGPAGRDIWASVAFAGGSEPGVLNLSTRMVGNDGRTHCVVATWNDDAPLEEQRLIEAYRGILRALSREADEVRRD